MKKKLDINNEIAKYKIPADLYIPENTSLKDIVILCHGFGGSKEGLLTKIITDKLIKNGIGAIAFDFPYHGTSCSGTEKLTVNNCVSDIEVIRNFLISQFPNCNISLCASSFGAYIAINSFWDGSNNFKYVILKSPAIDMKNILKNSLLKESFENYQKNGVSSAGHNGKMKLTYSFYEDLENHNILKENFGLRQKMLIFHGTADDTAPIEDTEKFSKLNSSIVKLVKIPQANHKMDIEYLNKIIDSSINSIKKINQHEVNLAQK